MILQACENAASSAGFTRYEMGATLTGGEALRRKRLCRRETNLNPIAERRIASGNPHGKNRPEAKVWEFIHKAFAAGKA